MKPVITTTKGNPEEVNLRKNNELISDILTCLFKF